MNTTSIDSQLTNAKALAFLRTSVGIFFLIFGAVQGLRHAIHSARWFSILDQQVPRWQCLSIHGFQYFAGSSCPTPRLIAFLVAFGEMAIGISLVLGIWVRLASALGILFMLTLLFSSNYPGAGAPLWQYFGASLDHSVLALCFLSFLIGDATTLWSLRSRLRKTQRNS